MRASTVEESVELHFRVEARPTAAHRLSSPQALRMRGRAAGSDGEHELAICLLQQAVSLSSAATPDLLALAEAFEQADRLRDAAAAFEWATRSAPAHAGPMRGLGRVLHRLGDYEEAEGIFARLLSLNPVDIDARVSLGRARRARGDRAGALDALEGAVRQVPGDPAAALELAQTFFESGAPDRALRALRKAGDPPGPEIAALRASCVAALGDVDGARGVLLRAQAVLSPDDPRAACLQPGLSLADVAEGHAQEAVSRLRSAFSQGAAPTPAQATAFAAAAIAVGRPEDALDSIDAAAAGPVTVSESAALAFARGDLLAASGHHGPAFLSWLEGNHRDPGVWSSDRAWDQVDRTRAWYSPRVVRSSSGAPRARDVVVVVGAPGSGAGRIAALLAQHPGVDAAPLGDPIAAAREAVPRRVGRPWPDCLDWVGLPSASRAARRAMGLDPSPRARPAGRTVLRLGARGLFDLGAVPAILPGARIVLVTRNPWDRSLSLFRRHLHGDGLEHSTALDDLAAAAEVADALTDHWRAAFRRPLTEVSFEALVQRPQATLAALAADLEMTDFSPGAGSALRTDAVGRWAHFARWLGPVGELTG